MLLQLFITPELHDTFCQAMDPRRGISAWAALAHLPFVQSDGSAHSFMVVRKYQLEGHFFDIPGHVSSAGRLNVVSFDVGSLILKVQQQPKLETRIRDGCIDAIRLGLLFGFG